jgi:hypothetical protein
LGEKLLDMIAAQRAAVAALVAAAKAMLDLEARRMYEQSMDHDARVRPCPCPGCQGLRDALAAVREG